MYKRQSSNIAISGQQTYTSSGVFTVPSYVRTVQVFLVGGGGGGQKWPNNGASSGSEHGSGGGGGGYTRTYSVSVTPGQQISVIVGAGGVTDDGGTRPDVYKRQTYSKLNVFDKKEKGGESGEANYT